MSRSIVILTGGDNAEREIALASSKNVQEALSKHVDVEVFDFPSQIDAFLELRKEFVCVVPVFHGKGGEDGVVQGFLEMLGIPYIFSGIEAHAIGMDKAVTKKLLGSYGITTASWVVLGPEDPYDFFEPVVIKPLDNGSSVGIHLVRKEEELTGALKDAFEYSSRVLVEQLIEGREFTVAVIDADTALPVIEIRSKNDFFDYESKYDSSLAEEICPAQIDESLAAKLQKIALASHTIIGARHLSRTDMIVREDGEIVFLEINTIPGLTNVSLAPKAIRVGGLDLGELLNRWINEVI